MKQQNILRAGIVMWWTLKLQLEYAHYYCWFTASLCPNVDYRIYTFISINKHWLWNVTPSPSHRMVWITSNRSFNSIFHCLCVYVCECVFGRPLLSLWPFRVMSLICSLDIMEWNEFIYGPQEMDFIFKLYQ